jgi:NAD(P)-dependent dehydrogenase (short-subunit alcohol dehydrogenase family)
VAERSEPPDVTSKELTLIKEFAMRDVIVLIGAGSIGQAIARRVSAGKHVLLADLRQDNVDAAAKVLGDAGFDVSTAIVDVSSRIAGRDPERRSVRYGRRMNSLSALLTAAGGDTIIIHAPGGVERLEIGR